MSRFQIIPFDVDKAGRETWAAFHVHRRAIAAELYPDDPVLDDAEREYEMRKTSPLWDDRRWLVLDGPDVVGSAGAGFRRPGTPDAEDHAPSLYGYGSVAARVRRNGIGTLLLQQVNALMHALDKSILTLSANVGAGHAFLTHIGAAMKLTTLDSRVLLSDVDWPRLRTWEDAAGDLRLAFESYRDRVPRETLVSLLPTISTFMSDMPLGSLERPPVRYEIEGYDQWYESLDRAGGAHHLVLLREPGGAVAGISDAEWDGRAPKVAYQGITAVARQWRGRGLARALKAALLRQVHAAHPCAEEMRTSNGDSNAAMLSINKRLGFSVVRRYVDYQVTRAELDARLPPAVRV